MKVVTGAVVVRAFIRALQFGAFGFVVGGGTGMLVAYMDPFMPVVDRVPLGFALLFGLFGAVVAALVELIDAPLKPDSRN